MDFKVSSPPITVTEALRFADELERVIGEIGNGKRKPANIPLEPMAALIQFARDAKQAHALAQSAFVDADHLAECSERMLEALNRKASALEQVEMADMGDIGAPQRAADELQAAEEACSEYWQAIRSAAYEYRKRAERARLALVPNAGINRRDGSEAGGLSG